MAGPSGSSADPAGPLQARPVPLPSASRSHSSMPNAARGKGTVGRVDLGPHPDRLAVAGGVRRQGEGGSRRHQFDLAEVEGPPLSPQSIERGGTAGIGEPRGRAQPVGSEERRRCCRPRSRADRSTWCRPARRPATPRAGSPDGAGRGVASASTQSDRRHRPRRNSRRSTSTGAPRQQWSPGMPRHPPDGPGRGTW